MVSRPLGHLLGHNVARVAFKRGAYLRNFVYEFAQMLSPELTQETLQAAMQTPWTATPGNPT
jgi:LysR family cys regulon transcriptional activator